MVKAKLYRQNLTQKHTHIPKIKRKESKHAITKKIYHQTIKKREQRGQEQEKKDRKQFLKWQ